MEKTKGEEELSMTVLRRSGVVKQDAHGWLLGLLRGQGLEALGPAKLVQNWFKIALSKKPGTSTSRY
jgi:hypothetical protein